MFFPFGPAARDFACGSTFHILISFSILLIAVILLGILFGVGIGAVTTATGMLTAQVTWESIAMAFGFSALIGLFFGIYPAYRAASLRPIEALRYE